MPRFGIAHVVASAALIAVTISAKAEIVENPTFHGPKTTISYSLWGGADEVKDARRFSTEFVKVHPEIRLDVVVYPWGQYWAKLQTQMASGLAPDVMQFYSGNFGVWVSRGALLPLDGLVRSTNFPLDGFYPQAIDGCRWNGGLYALPTDIASWCVIYSTDLMEQSGIGRDDWPHSDQAMPWPRFQDLCRRLTLRDRDGTYAQYGMAAGQNWDSVIAGMYGGDFVDRPVNPTRSTVKGNDKLARGLIELFQSQYGDRIELGAKPIADGAFTENTDTLLINRKFAMSTTGPWALRQLRDADVHFGLTPVPRASRPCPIFSVNSLGIYVHSRHQTEAWEFLRFMTSYPIEYARGHSLKGIPTLKAATDGFIHNEYGIPGCQAYLTDMQVASPYLTGESTDILAAREDWISDVEADIESEYDARFARLPRTANGIAPAAYRDFVAGMDSFIDKHIRLRMVDLDQKLQAAINATHPVQAGPFVRLLLPFIACLVLAIASVFYVLGVARVRAGDTKGDEGRKPSPVGYLFIGPWLIGLTCFVVGPILAAIALSFTEWNMITPPAWVGFQHYTNLPLDPKFLIGVKNTFLYALLVIPISLCGGLFTAGLLTTRIRGSDLFKAIVYFPALFTGAETAVLWVNMLNKDHGAFNYILSWLHISPIDWTDKNHAFFSVVLMNVFWVGGAMIIYYAGMKQIPATIYEAADIDGASLARKFIRITIPLLSPVILFMVVMTTIGSFQVFTPALFFAGDSTQVGSPNDALRFYSVNIYDQAFNNLRMGLACSYAIILFLIIFAITYVQFRVARRFVYTESE